MRSDTTLRVGIVALVTIISLYLIWPTLHYFLAVSGRISATPDQLDELRKNSVPLGLDLQGGVDVLLAIDTTKTRQNQVDGIAENLRKAFQRESPPIDATVELTSGSQQIALVVNKQEQVRSAENILLRDKQDQVFPQYQEGSLKAGQRLLLEPSQKLLEQDITKAVDSSLKVIRDRVDKLGVTQPIVVKQGRDAIRVQIPGEKDPRAVVKNIIKPAFLEFRGVHVDPNNRDDQQRYHDDSANYIDIKTGKAQPGKQIPPGYEPKPTVTQHTDLQSGKVTSSTTYMLVKHKAEMNGSMLKDAWVTINQASLQAGSMIQVSLTFSHEGANRFAAVTKEYVNKPLAILLDGVVYSAPNVRGVISEGNCVIEGNFSQEEARDLSLILKAGALPAELVTMEERTVEATLGTDSIKSSVFALALGSVIIVLFMALYYGTAGIIADVAMVINVLLIFAFMRLASATLTLSGIGGILLTVGMAVDANVLIYERIREEIKSGKSLKASISLGFSRAFGVIFDGNLCTLISGLVLLQFGAGSVQGFALALNVGIMATLFTGLFCTHVLVDFFFGKTGRLGIGKFQWFRDHVYYDIIGLKKYSYVWSATLFLFCLFYISPLGHGSNWGVDFTGGLLTDVTLTDKSIDTQKLEAGYGDWRVQKVANKEQFMIRTKLIGSGVDQIPKTQQEVQQRLEKIVGAGKFQIVGSEAVGNEVGAQFTWKAIEACLIASVGILIYMWFRFQFLFGFSAVVALFHDLIITFGLFNLFGTYKIFGAGEVTLDVVSALLVILGYSVHDTIIIFDRVRENLKLHPGMDFRKLINTSICESLNRTVTTVSTVLIVLLVMLLWGGRGLHDFALLLLIGIIKGTYSSSFVASPLLYDIHRYMDKKAAKAPASAKTIRPMLDDKA